MLVPSNFSTLSPDHADTLGVLDPEQVQEYKLVIGAVNSARPPESHMTGPRGVAVLQVLQQRGLARKRAGGWIRTEAGTKFLAKHSED